MGKTISTKLVIEGESEYKRSLSNINASLGALKAELSKTKAEFAENANHIDALRAKQEALGKIQQALAEKVKAAQAAFEGAKSAQGQYAAQVEACQTALTAAEQALERFQAAGKGSTEEERKLTQAVARQREELERAQRVNEAAQRAVNNYSKKLTDAQREQVKFNTEAGNNKKYMDEAKRSADGCAISIDAYGKKTREAEKSAELTRQTVASLAAALGAAGLQQTFRAAVQAIEACVAASITFESAMAGVRRTVGGTEEDVAGLGDAFQEMSVEMPITTQSLGQIAQTAGQLGVARDQVEQFTKVMAMLGTTTDLTAENAATMLAQFANITGLTDFERLGATVAELGDATATTASKVVEMSQGMAAAADVSGFKETDILALAAAVGSLGVEAEAGSTAMSTLISGIYKQVETGGGKLSQFAKVAGMSADDFAAAWREDAAGAFTAFIEGLNENEKSAVVLLDELGINNVRQTKAILGLANAGELLRDTLAQADRAWSENTALVEKASIMYETTQAKLTMLSNSFDLVKVAIGDALSPALNNIAEIGTDAFTWAADFIEKNPWLVSAIGAVAAALGTLTAAVAGYTIATKVILPLLASFNAALAANPIGAVAIAVASMTAALGVFIGTLPKASEGLSGMNRELEESHRSFKETRQALAQEETQVGGTVSALLQLADTEEKTNAQKETLLALVGQLNEAVPGLNLAYDEQADKLSMTTAQLQAYVKALMAQEQAETIIQRLKTLTQEHAALVEAQTAAQEELTAAQAAYNEMVETGSTGSLTELTDRLQRAQQEYDHLTGQMAANVQETAALEDEYNGLTEAAGKAGVAIGETGDKALTTASGMEILKKVINETKDGYQLLAKAQEETADSGYLTLDTIQKLMSSGLEGYLEEVEGGYRLTKGALDDYIASQQAEYATVLNEAKAAAVALITQNSDEAASIDEATDAIKRKIQALQAEARVKMNAHFAELATSNDFAGKNEAYMRQVMENDLTIKYLQGVESSAANALLRLGSAEKQMASLAGVTATLARDYGGSSASSSKSGSSSKAGTTSAGKEQTQAEKDLEAYKALVAELDHQRAMDEISEKDYFAKKGEYAAKYLAENAEGRKRLDEELYAWQKGAYDRDLAELKVALENETIIREEYLAGLQTLQERHFAEGTEGWLAAERHRQKEIAQANQDVYDDQKADLDYFYRMGLIDDQQYYTDLARLRDTYLEEDSAAWRSATLEIRNWVESQRKAQTEAAEREYQAQLKALQDALDAELDALKAAYAQRKTAAQEAYQAEKAAAKEAYEARKRQIKDELAAEKKRINAIIDGIDAEIKARKALREDESQDDAIAAARKRLDAGKAQLAFARTEEDRTQWEKEVIRLQQALDEAIQDKEDTAFYRQKEAEKEALNDQIAAAGEAADKALTEAQSDYDAKVAQLESDYKATLERLEAEYQASVSRLERKYASREESSGGSGGGKTYSDEVRAIARANNVDLGVAQDMYAANQRASASGDTPRYSDGGYSAAAKTAAAGMARAMGAVADSVTRAVTQTTTSITRNASANVTIHQASSLTSGQIGAAVQKTLDKLSR